MNEKMKTRVEAKTLVLHMRGGGEGGGGMRRRIIGGGGEEGKAKQLLSLVCAR